MKDGKTTHLIKSKSWFELPVKWKVKAVCCTDNVFLWFKFGLKTSGIQKKYGSVINISKLDLIHPNTRGVASQNHLLKLQNYGFSRKKKECLALCLQPHCFSPMKHL